MFTKCFCFLFRIIHLESVGSMITWSDVWEFIPKLPLKRLIFLLITAVFLLLGFLDFFTNHGSNRCEMTYMFERPEYLVSTEESLTLSLFTLFEVTNFECS
jgi:hypothetical protein